MNDERRCLVIDEQPAIRVGVRGMLADRYEVEEAADGRDALELITSLGNFDVAIVDLPSGNGHGNSLVGLAAIKALRKARPGLGIVAHGSRPERVVATEAIEAGATAFVAKSSAETALCRAVDSAADSETFVDPAARSKKNGSLALTRRQREILQLYAERPLDRGRRQASGPEHGDDPYPHEGSPLPPRGPRPHACGRDRHAQPSHRVAARRLLVARPKVHRARPDAEAQEVRGVAADN